MLGAVVLAAGLSSRMETFKPLLRIGGETMVSRVAMMMKRAGAEQVVVVTGYRREELEESLEGKGVIFVHNERYMETQMFDSLLLGLNAISKCDRILVSPGDVPLVLPETVEEILRIDAQFVRPIYKGEPGHPVVLKSEIIPILKRYDGIGGLRGAAEASGIEIADIETGDVGVVLDADSPEDYANLLEMFNNRKRRTVIFGAGQAGRTVLGLLNTNVAEAVAFGDNNPNKLSVDKIPVVPVEEALKLNPDLAIVSVLGGQRSAEFTQQVRNLGYRGELISFSEINSIFDIRAATLRRIAERIHGGGVQGCIAELGVYRGDFACLLNKLFPDRKLYLFDTFTGFDESDVEIERRIGGDVSRGSFSDTSTEEVLSRMTHKEQIVLRQGRFPETSDGLEESFALVSIDADLYAPTLAGLEYFYPRLGPGGVIILHDYNSERFKGVREAVKEYEGRHGLLPLIPLCDVHGSAVIIKGGRS